MPVRDMRGCMITPLSKAKNNEFSKKIVDFRPYLRRPPLKKSPNLQEVVWFSKKELAKKKGVFYRRYVLADFKG